MEQAAIRAGSVAEKARDLFKKIEAGSHELTRMETEIRAGLATLRLEAYDSEVEQAWCLALPA